MTDDELALIRAATAEPDEDTLRLAYADWLDEQGGAAYSSQAAFVRLQVRRARLEPADPERVTLLEQETAHLQKHRRDWNGRIHRHLLSIGFKEKVDARRGPIRSWNYSRGMIGQVTVTPEALTALADLVFALGPVEHVRLATWPDAGWASAAGEALGPFLPRLKVVSLAGVAIGFPNLAGLKPFLDVPVLDLRSVGLSARSSELLAFAGAGSSVVLYYRNVTTVLRTVGNYHVRDHRAEVHVIDPRGEWDELRLPFARVTGEVLAPVPYQGTSE